MLDVAVIGSGPNGLAAAVMFARAGLDVTVFEAETTVGGGTRTLHLTKPGFLHDWGSAVHAMAFASPFFNRFGIQDRVEFVVPEVSYGHALNHGQAGIAWRDIDRTADGLGRDGPPWLRLLKPLVERAHAVTDFTMSPLLPFPRSPSAAFRYGWRTLEQATVFADARFRDELAPAMLAGVLAHSVGRIPSFGTSATGLMLAMLAHHGGWPIPVGGSQAIADAMAKDILAFGGSIETGQRVTDLGQIPPARAVVFDTAPGQLLKLAGPDLTPRYRRALQRFRHRNGASKVDFALSEPVPWTSAGLRLAGTLHLGGTRNQVATSEAAVARGRHPEDPYLLVSQPSVFDASRAPSGQHTLWAYTHVPAGSNRDMTEPIIKQIERFAPGFRDVMLASHATPATAIERGNVNFVGGDIAAGAINLRQLIARPVLSANPWRSGPGLYLCSASTVPGPGVHGMSGFHAARLALHEVFRLPVPVLAPATATRSLKGQRAGN